MARTRSIRPSSALGLLIVVTGGALITAAGCGRQAQVAANSFVGDQACAPCHQSEFRSHEASNHKLTMREVNSASLGKLMPKAGDISEGLVLKQSGATLAMAWRSGKREARKLDWALGSGKYAITYLSVMNEKQVMQLRQSQYPGLQEWRPTPGEDFVGDRDIGLPISERESRECIGCHATTLPPSGIKLAPQFQGVGCESCHGPGQKHVTAMQSGSKSERYMEKLGGKGAAHLNEVCGICHRTQKEMLSVDADKTNRFQPYGLMQSRCFKESGNVLSCSTCHDPHMNAAKDARHYENACLNCHSSGVGPADPRVKSCPVEPRTGCVSCHMPTRPVTKGSPISMADHWIRVWTREMREFHKQKDSPGSAPLLSSPTG